MGSEYAVVKREGKRNGLGEGNRKARRQQGRGGHATTGQKSAGSAREEGEREKKASYLTRRPSEAGEKLKSFLMVIKSERPRKGTAGVNRYRPGAAIIQGKLGQKRSSIDQRRGPEVHLGAGDAQKEGIRKSFVLDKPALCAVKGVEITGVS